MAKTVVAGYGKSSELSVSSLMKLRALYNRFIYEPLNGSITKMKLKVSLLRLIYESMTS